MAFGVTFAAPPPRGGGAPETTLVDAVRAVGRQHDLSGIIWLRPAGGGMRVRLVEDGEYRAYAVTGAGLTAIGRNWPRLLHEGNWRGYLSASLNVITAVALIGLLGTGLYAWGRRQVRRRRTSGRAIPAA
jgi:uncharacterized iron-regulated membrane protein